MSRRLARFAWVVLYGNVAVILWGAFVRATGSGAGCGNHWPLCNGDVVPRAASIATLIELSHRVSSGVALALVMALGALTFRDTPPGHPARKAATASMILIWGEVFIGAGLVLLKLVAHDTSLLRGVSMELHAGNTFLLVAALTLTAHFASGGAAPRVRLGQLLGPVGFSFAALALTFASGAIAALGDTLFPARSISAGLAEDLSPHAHIFLRLRTLHPLYATTAAVLIVIASGAARTRVSANDYRGTPEAARSVKTLSTALTIVIVCQVGLGILNLTLLVPIATQLLHLAAADAVFVLLVLLTAHLLAPDALGASSTPEPALPLSA